MENTFLASWYEESDESSSSKEIEFTIKNYNKYIKLKDRKELAKFIYHRLYGRYIKPFEFKDELYIKQYKNGFAIMVNCCLLIETLQSFKRGWEDTRSRSKDTFTDFFNEEKAFKQFKRFNFYKNIRCGILHQGEVVGGYKIRRDGMLFDESTKTINSVKFIKELHKSLNNYKSNLESEEWDNEIWDNFRRKMRAVIENCK